MSRRYSREKWILIIEKFKGSGKSAKEWAKEEGISYQSLIIWRKKLREKSSFIELEGSTGTFELRWKGIKIELSSFEELKEFGQFLVEWC